MRTYRVTLRYTAGEIDRAGTALADHDYGTYGADSPEAALRAALYDADATREYDAPVLLSTSAGYGRGAPRSQGDGHGAQDRSEWWYVADVDGRLCGIYAVADRGR